MVDSKVSLTFDMWTSLNGDPFLGVTRHYIISSPENPHQWDLKTVQLAFTPIVRNHSGETSPRFCSRLLMPLAFTLRYLLVIFNYLTLADLL